MQQGFIYSLTNTQGQMYIGSTTTAPATRFAKHKSAFKRFRDGLPVSPCSAFTVFAGCAEGEKPNMQIIEELMFDSPEELLRREGHYIRENAAICVNKAVAGRTKLEHYRDNAETIKMKSRQYYNENKEQILEKRRNQRYRRLFALGLI